MKHRSIIILCLLSLTAFALTDAEWQQKAAALVQAARDDARAVVTPTPTPSPTPSPTPEPTPTPTPSPTPTPTPDDALADPHGADVTIPSGKTVRVYSDITVGALVIEGRVEVANTATITAGYILAQHGGVFAAGSKDAPFNGNLTVTLNGKNKTAVAGMGGRLIGAMMGGRIELYGTAPAVSWTMLDADASVGSQTITLSEAVDWKSGDELIVTSTTTDYSETEQRTILAVEGKVVTLRKALANDHSGTILHVDHQIDGTPHEIDKRAEVGLLSRNIVIQGPEDAGADGYGGHLMVMDPESVLRLQGVEFVRMGQAGIKGRYPIHRHDGRDASNCSIISCTVHDSYNRGITIHKSNGCELADNIVCDTYGHGFFMEDGKETLNTYTHNLSALIHRSDEAPGVTIGLDAMDFFGNPGDTSCFWITNPNNDFVNNAAAGAAAGGNGFWFAVRSTPAPGSISEDANYNPSTQPVGKFIGNRSHSTGSPRVINVDTRGSGLWLQVGSLPYEVTDFTSFSNGTSAIWTGASGGANIVRGRLEAGVFGFVNRNNTNIKNTLTVASGISHAAMHIYEGAEGTQVYDSVFSGFNLGNPNPALVYSFEQRENEIDGVRHSQFIACDVGFWSHSDFQEISNFVVGDPDNSFGYGAGSFVYSRDDSALLRNERSKKLESSGLAHLNEVKSALNNPSFAESAYPYVTPWFTPSHLCKFGVFSVPDVDPGNLYLFARVASEKDKHWIFDKNWSWILPGREYEIYLAEGAQPITPKKFQIGIRQAEAGEIISFFTDYPHKSVSVVLNGQSIPAAKSLDDYRSGTDTAMFLGNGVLYLRVKVQGDNASLIVSETVE